MHVISRKALRDFWEIHPSSKSSLTRWYKIISQSEFASFNELRTAFPSADLVNDLLVFNISGNNNRLIASVHFNRGKVYVRAVLTHGDDDRGTWKQ